MSTAPDPRLVAALVAFVLLWMAAWTAASIVYRRRRGKPIVPRVAPGALYWEKAASGASYRNWLTRLGGAQNCLIAAVTETHLQICPRFPFNLIFLPEIYDLEHWVARTAIGAVDVRRGLFRPTVELQFAEQGRSARIGLHLKDAQRFVATLQAKTA